MKLGVVQDQRRDVMQFVPGLGRRGYQSVKLFVIKMLTQWTAHSLTLP